MTDTSRRQIGSPVASGRVKQKNLGLNIKKKDKMKSKKGASMK
jgi:hypothetical protein